MSTILILLLLFTIPQILWKVPDEIRLGQFDVHLFDVFTVLAFVWWLRYFITVKNSVKSIHFKLNNIYILLLLVGIIPVIVGAFHGKDNILGAYRLFFYFVWVPTLVRYIQQHRHPFRVVYYLVIVNLLSTILALVKHFTTIGFEIGYIEIHNELNLFILLTLFSIFFSKQCLFSKNKIMFVSFILFLFALFFDLSRKMYLAFILGSILLCISNIKARYNKQTGRFIVAGVAIALLIFGIFNHFGWSSHFKSRFKTIFVVPGVTSIESVDESIGFRLATLKVGLEIIRKYPFLGTGSGESLALFEKIREQKRIYGIHYHGYSPHNFYLSMAVSFGIPITAFICSIVIYLLKLSWSNMKKNNKDKLHAAAKGMLIGFIGFAIAMFFEGLEIFTTLDVWLFLGLALGFANLNQGKQLCVKKPTRLKTSKNINTTQN